MRPKHGKFEDSTYEDVLPELADHEFESYTKNNYFFAQRNNTSNNDNYMDYGFKMPYRLNSQVSLSSKTNETDSNNYKSSCSNSNSYLEASQSQESYRYFKIIQKLTKSSLTSPANVPILCTLSFNQSDVNCKSYENKTESFKILLNFIVHTFINISFFRAIALKTTEFVDTTQRFKTDYVSQRRTHQCHVLFV